MGNELSVVLCAQHPGVVSELLAEGCGSCFLTRLLGMAGGYWGASLMRQDSRRALSVGHRSRPWGPQTWVRLV